MLPVSISMLNTPKPNFNRVFNPLKIKLAIKEANDRKSRETLVYMLPNQFLDLAKALKRPNEESLTDIRNAIENNDPLTDVPYLKTEHVKGFEFKVTGHEGRHRSIVLNNVNNRLLMPVRLIDISTRWIEDEFSNQIITLSGQGSSNKRVSVKLP